MSMIPTVMLLAFVVGRWRVVPALAVAWALLLLCTGTIGMTDLPLAAALAAGNAVVGVIPRWALRFAHERRQGPQAV
jgi:hypothetical protein